MVSERTQNSKRYEVDLYDKPFNPNFSASMSKPALSHRTNNSYVFELTHDKKMVKCKHAASSYGSTTLAKSRHVVTSGPLEVREGVKLGKETKFLFSRKVEDLAEACE